MLGENIKSLRRSRGLSREELAIKLNVVRQTISKWERGLSVPDSEMLIALGDALDAPVSALLGGAALTSEPSDLEALSEKLELVNLQLARMHDARRRAMRWALIALAAISAIGFAVSALLDGSYLGWNFADPESAVAATLLHGFEWVCVRIAPLVFIGAIAGVIALRPRS